ncbi:MAG: DUF1344 domain-containing protein [Rhodobacteraceae bacterium]|nr:DUF1344 domain-containing protein [Paracoccaceae bacterium]
MHRKVLPIALVAALALSGAALAASATEGAVKSINLTEHSVTLDNGTTYYFPDGTDLSGFRVGDRVSVHWTMKDSRHEADTIQALRS